MPNPPNISRFSKFVKDHYVQLLQSRPDFHPSMHAITNRRGIIRHSLNEDYLGDILFIDPSIIKLVYDQEQTQLIVSITDTPLIIPLHTYWRHLNSSQILALNYFIPYVAHPQDLQPLLDILQINDSVTKIDFEVVLSRPRFDGSHIDVQLQLTSGHTIFIEVKYTEEAVGKAKSPAANYQLIKDTYHSQVEISFEDYLQNYQLVRMMSQASRTSGNYSLFLVPEANTSLVEQLTSGLQKIQNANEFNTKVLYWEDLLNCLPNNRVKNRYFWWRT